MRIIALSPWALRTRGSPCYDDTLGPAERRDRLWAAALATLARYYHRPLSVEQMRDLAGTDRIGTTLLGLVQAAEGLGFAAKR